MKKLIIFIGVLTLLAMNSCKSDYVQSIDYQLAITGQSDGTVEVNFPHGDFTTNGAADILLNLHAKDSLLTANVLTLDRALAMNDAKVQKAAQRVEKELSNVYVKKADGNYFIHIKGYAKEPITGLVFAIDRTFTNK